jgi:hypothetical protein
MVSNPSTEKNMVSGILSVLSISVAHIGKSTAILVGHPCRRVPVYQKPAMD